MSQSNLIGVDSKSALKNYDNNQSLSPDRNLFIGLTSDPTFEYADNEFFDQEEALLQA